MRPRTVETTPFAVSNPNKEWVAAELDRLIGEWHAWLDEVRGLPVSVDYNPDTCSEALKDGWSKIRQHDVLREKTLVFLRNNFSGLDFAFSNWPSPPHEDNTSRLQKRVPGWIHRLDVIKACLTYARVPDGFWKDKGKKLVDKLATVGPEKAAEIAASWLKNPFSD